MKAYKFQIWHEVAPNGKFSHNAERVEIIHANNLKAAKAKVELGMTLSEWIYKYTCLGTVRKVVEVRYEYTPLKKPKYESGY